MTLEELKDKIESIVFVGYGHYKVTIRFRGKRYRCTTNNTLATDRAKYGCYEPRKKEGMYTMKQALESLYNECKEKNGL